MHRVKIGTVLFDQAKGAAIVTLVDEAGRRILPIFIGLWEGMAIFRELNRAPAPRPMLHDLFCHVLLGFGARLEKVIVDTLRDNTFYARLYVRQQDAAVVIDARPSDAIALAVKCQAPIYVAEEVLAAAGKVEEELTAEEKAPEERREAPSTEDVRAWLENLRPEDFADPH
ncbi:MAG: hypothetical protein KatS3mg131_1859 [Candidatus Tectimicrobiota bacterium]|nr:MAG: hypothetical protein KatS3mg131_1859 [Candidatus Tectomicrobia bacterium]